MGEAVDKDQSRSRFSGFSPRWSVSLLVLRTFRRSIQTRKRKFDRRHSSLRNARLILLCLRGTTTSHQNTATPPAKTKKPKSRMMISKYCHDVTFSARDVIANVRRWCGFWQVPRHPALGHLELMGWILYAFATSLPSEEGGEHTSFDHGPTRRRRKARSQ